MAVRIHRSQKISSHSNQCPREEALLPGAVMKRLWEVRKAQVAERRKGSSGVWGSPGDRTQGPQKCSPITESGCKRFLATSLYQARRHPSDDRYWLVPPGTTITKGGWEMDWREESSFS